MGCSLTFRPARYGLEVTNFSQTPYAQRVANTKRAELNQTRTFVEEALNNDEDTETILGFELNVPEHLPRSPLCPLSPKHKSGGKAICPMHGRKVRLHPIPSFGKPVLKPSRSARVDMKTVKQEPKIVYEGVAEGVRRGNGEFSTHDPVISYRRQSSGGDDVWYS